MTEVCRVLESFMWLIISTPFIAWVLYCVYNNLSIGIPKYAYAVEILVISRNCEWLEF